MPGPREFDYVIVGGGLAAASAVDGIREMDPSGTILVLTDEAEPPYQRPPLSKEYLQYPDLPRSLLHVKPEGWFEGREALRLETRQAVLMLDPAGMSVTTARGNVYRGSRILLATGGRARRPVLPGSDLSGVLTLRTVEDSETIRAAAATGNRAALVGGGFVGMELAASLTVHDVSSVVFEALDRVWPGILPPALAEWMQGLFEEAGVVFRLGSRVERFVGDGHVEAVVADGEEHPCDFAVVGVGMSPCDGLASEAGLAVDDGVRVDGFGETSHPYVYAAGDVARFPDPVFGGSSRLEHWEHAREHGRVVGRNMAGAEEEYRLLSYFFSRVFDLSLDVIGRPREADSLVFRGRPGHGPCIVLGARSGRVSGAVLLDSSPELESVRKLVGSRPLLREVEGPFEDESISLGSLAERVHTDRDSTPGKEPE
jgi:3-phenylpropionate/trans-cinnamate dioxygenase ferredoxin reductase subunit